MNSGNKIKLKKQKKKTLMRLFRISDFETIGLNSRYTEPLHECTKHIKAATSHNFRVKKAEKSKK